MANNTNNGVNVQIGASAGGLQSALQQSVQSLQQSVTQMTSLFSQLNQASSNSATQTTANASRINQAFSGIRQSAAGVGSQVQQSISGIASSMGPAGSAVSTLASGMSGGLMGVAAAAAAAGAALAAMVIDGSVEKLREHVKESKTLALAFDTTASRASAMADVFEDSGVNSDALLGVSQALTKSLTKNQETFEKYGISIKDSNGQFLSQEAILGNVIDKYKTMATSVDKQVFLQQTLRGVSQETIEKMAKAYGDDLPSAISKSESALQKLGAIASDQDISSVEKYNQSIRDMADIMDGAAQSFAAGILPALTEMKEGFNSTFGDGSLAELARSFGQVVGDVFIVLGEVIGTFVSFLASIFQTIGELFGEYVTTTDKAGEDSMSTWDYMVVGIQAAIGVISIGLQTLVSFFKTAFVSVVEIVRSAAHTVIGLIEAIVNGTTKLAQGDLSGAANAVTSAYQKVSQSWKNTGATISATFNGEMDKIGKAVEQRADKLADSWGKRIARANSGAPTFNNKPGVGSGTNSAMDLKDGKGSSGGGKKDDTTKAEYALIKARLEAELMLLKDGLTRQQEVLDSKLKDNLVSHKQYYDERARLQKEELNKQIEMKRKELEQNEQLQAKATKQSEKINLQAAAVKLQAEMVVLKNKEADVDRKSLEMLKEKQKEMEKLVVDMRAQLATAQQSLDPSAAFAQIELKFKDTIDKLIANSDFAGAEIVRKLLDIEKTKAQLDAMEREFKIFEAKRSIETEKIKQKEKLGEITSAQAKKLLRDKEKEEIQKQIELKQEMLKLAEKDGRVVDVATIQADIEKLKTMKTDVNEFGQSVNAVFETAFAGFFEDVINGTKSVSDAFKDMGKQILAQIAQIVAKWMAAKIMGAFNPGGAMSGAGGGGGSGMDFLTSAASMIFGGFKETGGYTMSGNAYVVGEKGPELFVPQSAGSIIPNGGASSMGGGQSINMHISTPDANSFRRSASQIGTSYANALNRNLRRNG